MSVVASCSLGYLLDHEAFITSSCGSLPFESHPGLFNTFEPYIKSLKTSNNTATDGTGIVAANQDISRKRKKRKRKHPLNAGEKNALEYHEKVRDKIKEGLEALGKLASWSKYFGLCCSIQQEETNNLLQAASDCSDVLSVVNNVTINNTTTLFPAQHMKYEAKNVVNRVVFNDNDTSMLFNVSNTTYILPARSSFLLSDVAHLSSLVKTLDSTYDVIVIDPPWENKSVKRGSKYSSLPLWEIKNLPITELASNNALVAVWVTNKQKYRTFVLEELFPAWSCTPVAEWHWIKLTKQGELIHDLESRHKKPYEPLLIGQFKRNVGEELWTNKEPSAEHGDVTGATPRPSIPDYQVMCSIPCSLHSRKPPLNDVFLNYLPSDVKCIELFARNLLPHWTSWGNEVLKYQHLDYFQDRKNSAQC